MCFLPIGFLCDPGAASWSGLAANLIPVTLGNLVGGAGVVGLVAYVIHRRDVPLPR